MTTTSVNWRRLVWLGIAVAALFLSAPALTAPAATAGPGVSTNAVFVANPGTRHYPEFDPVSLQMSASGGVAPYTWSAVGLSTTLRINPATGLISGWARAGNWTVTVTATDSTGAAGSTTFLIQVARECRTC